MKLIAFACLLVSLIGIAHWAGHHDYGLWFANAIVGAIASLIALSARRRS